MDDARLALHEEAITRWIAALNRFGDPAAVTAAVTDDVVVERFGFYDHAGRLVEVLRGPRVVGRWMAMSPPDTLFDLPAPLALDETPEGLVGVATFRVQLPDFDNRGRWRFRLAPDGRIASLAHHPGEIDDAAPERIPEEMQGQWQARFEDDPEGFAALGTPGATCAHGDHGHEHGPGCEHDHGHDHGHGTHDE